MKAKLKESTNHYISLPHSRGSSSAPPLREDLPSADCWPIRRRPISSRQWGTQLEAEAVMPSAAHRPAHLPFAVRPHAERLHGVSCFSGMAPLKTELPRRGAACQAGFLLHSLTQLGHRLDLISKLVPFSALKQCFSPPHWNHSRPMVTTRLVSLHPWSSNIILTE